MSKEAEDFFRQKTIENATRPSIKKSIALINREEEGRIMQEYADLQLNSGNMQITKRKTDTGYIVEIRYTLNGVKNKKAILIDCDPTPNHKPLQARQVML